jgi:cobalt-zinc-cadmium resistance protein CzcA
MMTLLAKLLRFSVEHRVAVLVITACVAVFGGYNFTRLPIDAVPDITNVQVQINTPVQALAPSRSSGGSPSRSSRRWPACPSSSRCGRISRYGLSQVTVVFEDGTDIYLGAAAGQRAPRRGAATSLPAGQRAADGADRDRPRRDLHVDRSRRAPARQEAATARVHLTDLRTIQDWIVRPQLRNLRGVTEVNSIGGYEQAVSRSPRSRSGWSRTTCRFATCSRRWRTTTPTRAGATSSRRASSYLVRVHRARERRSSRS